MNAYDRVYLGRARISMGRMLDYAVNDLQMGLEEYYKKFLESDVAFRFAKGDCSLIAGRSGVELVYEVMSQNGQMHPDVSAVAAFDKSREYWAGWALSYYQWETGFGFDEIESFAPIVEIREMYAPFHEMDIRQFVDCLNEKYRHALPDTNLKRKRRNAGLSQKDLAELSGIPLRTIQQYEQKQKNINKAQVDYLVRLSGALGCPIECLIEKVECKGGTYCEKKEK